MVNQNTRPRALLWLTSTITLGVMVATLVLTLVDPVAFKDLQQVRGYVRELTVNSGNSVSARVEYVVHGSKFAPVVAVNHANVLSNSAISVYYVTDAPATATLDPREWKSLFVGRLFSCGLMLCLWVIVNMYERNRDTRTSVHSGEQGHSFQP